MNLYHKRFLNSFTSESVIALFSRYKGAAKEVTESWAMLEAVKKYCPDINDSHVVIAGDGASPRTGALIAYYTRATVISVDPQMNESHYSEWFAKQELVGHRPERLVAMRRKIQELDNKYVADQPLVVIWPHSHAPMNEYNPPCKSRIDIAMPCCVPIPKEWMLKPHITYVDDNVESPERTIHIWGAVL